MGSCTLRCNTIIGGYLPIRRKYANIVTTRTEFQLAYLLVTTCLLMSIVAQPVAVCVYLRGTVIPRWMNYYYYYYNSVRCKHIEHTCRS